MTLLRPKTKVDLAVPDATYYYVACVTTRILYWFHHQKDELWVLLENTLNRTPFPSLESLLS